jgi:hypothetical protein
MQRNRFPAEAEYRCREERDTGHGAAFIAVSGARRFKGGRRKTEAIKTLLGRSAFPFGAKGDVAMPLVGGNGGSRLAVLERQQGSG